MGSNRLSSHQIKVVRRWQDTVTLIYPNNKYIIVWDWIIMVLLVVTAFMLPVDIGVAIFGYFVTNVTFVVVTTVISAFFLVDCFLNFFRVTYDDRKLLVINPHTIRIRYLKSYFVPYLLGGLPISLILYLLDVTVLENSKGFHNAAKFLQVFNFLRFYKFQDLASQSETVDYIRLNMKYWYRLIFYFIVEFYAAHISACIWCWTAILETGGNLEKHPNWILYWNETATEGSLNPFPAENIGQRYLLSLFWAIQTLTSIGYGNIAALTTAEYAVSCLLQLISSIVLSYVVGGMIDVVQQMQGDKIEYRKRMDDANKLFESFMDENEYKKRLATEVEGEHVGEVLDFADPIKVAHKIKSFLRIKYHRDKIKRELHRLPVKEAFPVLAFLPPELSEAACYLVLCEHINVPYLLPSVLPIRELHHLAGRAELVDFGSGQVALITRADTDRHGVMIVRLGSVLLSKSDKWGYRRSRIATIGTAFAEATVFLEDGDTEPVLRIGALSFSQVIFFSRDSIHELLDRNPEAKRASRGVVLRIKLEDWARSVLAIYRNNYGEDSNAVLPKQHSENNQVEATVV